ncbi:YggS family pyridoxal phosphate-dependent enzyme [Proteus sp. FME41]|uniref:YggS family pyridoxal phosphate-dependent enzyme n=1 Tax=Proteus sp. FME41 TaxID=2742608 RepID=UPI001866D62B|nr:YggS family pyridoxal phosphate-dependent enzyme [Proteus sp. FME41]
MNTIKQNLVNVRSHIDIAAQKCGRSSEEITLLAVSKTKPASDIEKAIACGQTEFGENYVQEGIDKINYFSDNSSLVWHFIGPLQSNKTRLVAEHFDWCHTIDRLKIAQRLSDQRPDKMPPLNVLIQINISDENSKSGINLTELDGLAAQISILSGIKLRGLMAIPAPESHYDKQVEILEKMHLAFKQLQSQYPNIDTLSMGMSSDMEAAIACGSTLVRIGTAIFGARDYAAK